MTVHGKGTFVAETCQEQLMEERKKDVERALEQAASKGLRSGLSAEDVRSLFEIIMEDIYAEN